MRRRGLAIVLLSFVAAAGCARGDRPLLVATDVAAYAPLPGARTAVVYFELHNASDDKVTITDVSSPAFARVEWHETIIENGVSRMVQLESPVIDAGGSLLLQPGGKHLMLIEPQRSVAAGSPLTLRVTYDGDRLVELTTTLKDRTAP